MRTSRRALFVSEQIVVVIFRYDIALLIIGDCERWLNLTGDFSFCGYISGYQYKSV